MIQKYTFSHRKIKELLEKYQKLYKASPKDQRKRLDYKIWSYLRDEAKCGVRAEFDDIWCIVYDIDCGKVICSLSLDHPFAELLKENTPISSLEKKQEEIDMAVDRWGIYDTNNHTNLASCNCNSATVKVAWNHDSSGWGADSTNAICMNVDENNFHIGSKSIKEVIEDVINDYDKNKNNKEKDEMKGFKFDFGPCTNDNIRMSTYGLAVKNGNDEWVSYDSNSDQIINVDLLNFDGRKYMFKMPVAIKDIAVGDIIIHNRVPMFVISITDGIFVVDPRAGEEKKILPTHSPFGFDFMTKVVSMFAAFASVPTPDQPFGNFLPFMFMDENSDIDPMMFMLMAQQNGGDMFSNPMMMYFLCGNKMKDNSMLPFMFLMNQNQPHKGKNGK